MLLWLALRLTWLFFLFKFSGKTFEGERNSENEYPQMKILKPSATDTTTPQKKNG